MEGTVLYREHQRLEGLIFAYDWLLVRQNRGILRQISQQPAPEGDCGAPLNTIQYNRLQQIRWFSSIPAPGRRPEACLEGELP